MMTMTNLATKFAVVQFGNEDDKEIAAIAKEITKNGTDWYLFAADADRAFEIRSLYGHYDCIFECLNRNSFEEIK